jgi:hypothetical protein
MVAFCNKYDLFWKVSVIVGFFRHRLLETASLSVFRAGLWSQYTKLPTQTPQFLKL